MINTKADGSFEGYDSDRITRLMAGETPPLIKAERDLIKFIGGVRKRPWPQEWRTCRLCGVEWQAEGHPWEKGRWRYATVCQPCSDMYDAGLHPKHPEYWKNKEGAKAVVKEKKKVKQPYKEDE